MPEEKKAKFTPSQVKKLNVDKDFQERVRNDEELNKLFSSPDKTPEEQEMELYTVLGGRFCISDTVYIKPVSAGIIAILSALDSPLVCPKKGTKVLISDVDAALFVMCNGRQAMEYGGIRQIASVSRGFCELIKIDPSETYPLLQRIIKACFAGSEYFPDVAFANERPVSLFDAEWLTRQIRITSEVSAYTPDEILWEVPMTTTSYLSVQLARKNGQRIDRPNRAAEAMARLEALMEERIKEKSYK